MHRIALPVLLLVAPLAGCSSGSGLSTSSILGGAATPPAGSEAGTPVAASPLPSSTPIDRGFLVGSVSARASKCGYNFDAVRLKSSYLANEASRGTLPAQIAEAEKAYGVALNGVAKAAAEDPNYCSESKTQQIKADLNRLLAGDFEPRKVVAQKQQDGIFDGWFDGSSADTGPKFGTGDWWDSQKEKAGN